MSQLRDMSDRELLALYVESAQGYIDAVDGGKARRANRHHGVAGRVFREVKRRGAEKEILMLLSHARPAVRLWAAVHSLGIDPDSARQVLEELSSDPTPAIGLYADLALDMFHKGKLPGSGA
jgi:hypothetical protein